MSANDGNQGGSGNQAPPTQSDIWAVGGIDENLWRAYNTQPWRKFRTESTVDITLDQVGLTSSGGLDDQPAAFAP